MSDAWAARLQRAIIEAYDRVVETAIDREVDFVVLAGDMFDTSRPSFGDYLHFFEGLERLDAKGIPVYMVAGNHDPYASWRNDIARLPENAHLMGGDSPDFALFERDGEPLCLIGARGYRNQAWPIEDPIAGGISRREAVEALSPMNAHAGAAPFSIGIVHTGLNIDQSKAYSDPQALLASDVDYWACGHLHKRLVLPDAGSPRIVFPGCVQGRDIKESGERGCFVVTMERAAEGRAGHPQGGKLNVALEAVSTASVVFHTVKADVSACQTLADVSRFVMAQLFHENAEASCDEMVVRVVLEGQTDLHTFLARPDVLSDLRKRLNNAYPTFFCDTLVDRTRPPFDRRALKREGLFAGIALGVADQQRARKDEMVNYVQSEFVKRGVDVPSSLARQLDCFNDEAETLVMSLLEEERE